jgi:hypothetical protein
MSELNLPVGGSMRRLAVMLIVSMLCTGAFAEQRVALVIGNSDYDHIARLDNPVTMRSSWRRRCEAWVSI